MTEQHLHAVTVRCDDEWPHAWRDGHAGGIVGRVVAVHLPLRRESVGRSHLPAKTQQSATWLCIIYTDLRTTDGRLHAARA